MDYLSCFFCLPRPELVLDQLGACLNNPLALSELGENNMLCYKHCTSFLKRLCFKMSMFQENMRDKTFEYSSLFLSRRWDQFFQQVSLKGSEIICNFKKVMKTTIKKMADVAKHRCNVQQNGKPTNSKGIFFFSNL